MRRRRILKANSFDRWALRAGLSDAALLTAVQEIAQGLIDGELVGLRELARDLLELSERQIDAQTKSGALEEIIC